MDITTWSDAAGRPLFTALPVLDPYTRPAGPWDANTAPIKPIVSICGWCPDPVGRTRAAMVGGRYDISHGICATCVSQLEVETK